MVRWTMVGSLGAVIGAMGVHASAQHSPRARSSSVPELSVSGLRTGASVVTDGPVAPGVRMRTSGISCILTSGVRSLPDRVELRIDGQARRVPVRNTITHAGRMVGEIAVPWPLLDGVDWRLSDISVEADDGAVAELSYDGETGGCVAHLPVSPDDASVDVVCPIRRGGVAPPVRALYLWEPELLPVDWDEASASAERNAYVLYDVAPTGTAELDVGLGTDLLLRWKDGVCAEVSVDLDAELCVRVPEGGLVFDDPSYRLYVDDTMVPLDGAGEGCAPTRMGEALVTQVWMTQTSARERSELVSVSSSGRQVVDVDWHPLDTAAGALFWPSVLGPRVVSVRGLAETMGVRDGDILVAVNGQSVAGEPMADVVARLDGTESSVVLTLDRSDVLVDVTLLFDETDGDF